MPLIVYMIDYLDANNLKNMPSYVEIVKLIELIQKKPLSKSSDKTINFDYGRLKSLLLKSKKDDISGFRNEILSLLDLSYEELKNIAITNPVLAGKLEKMYQLEKLLEKYCKMELARYLIPGKKDYDFHSDQLGLLDSINLSTMKLTGIYFIIL